MSSSIRKRDVSPMENCGFVLHFLTLSLIIVYALWLAIPGETLEAWDVNNAPRAWFIYIQTSIVCILVSILFLNAAMNASIAPNPDSIHTILDEHSKPQLLYIPMVSDDGGLPEICDIDVGLINNMIQRRLLDDAR